MAKVPETYNFGSVKNPTTDELLRIIADLYKDLAIALNKKPDLYVRTTDGQSSDTFLSDGDININSNTLKIEMLSRHNTPTNVTWTTIS
jgi:hypothetical protein